MRESEPRYTKTYTFVERLRIVLPLAAAGLLSLYFVSYKLDEVLEDIHCQTYLGINGFSWVWASLFIGLPLLLLLSVVIAEGKNCIHALKLGEYPRPEKKVFFKSEILSGKKAKLKGTYILLATVFIFLFLLWGIGQAFHPPEVDKSVYEKCIS